MSEIVHATAGAQSRGTQAAAIVWCAGEGVEFWRGTDGMTRASIMNAPRQERTNTEPGRKPCTHPRRAEEILPICGG
jgi:hypothetical protein